MPIGVSTAKRLDVLPDVPPVNDTVPDFDVASWQMVVAPAKTPRGIVERLHVELKSLIESKEISGAIAKTGMAPLPTPSVESMQAFLKSEIARWGKVVQQAGIAGKPMMGLRGIAFVLPVVVCAATIAGAQPYPAKPVTIVLPYAAGGNTDAIARTLANRLEQKMGQPFVIELRLGAASVIGATHVARAAPDGYIILIGTSTTMAINVSVYKKLPYDPTRDLVPIALVAGVPFILVIDPALPIKSLARSCRRMRNRNRAA